MPEVSANGVSLHVQRLGSGRPTVVFIHGLVMDNLSSWYFTLGNRAASIADVVLYDLRGHGRSERPHVGYTVLDMVDDLRALLDQLHVDSAHLIGNSFGGLVALAFAVAHPNRTDGLVLVDGHTGAHDWALRMTETLALQGEARDHMIAMSFRSWMGRHSQRKRTRLGDTARAIVYATSLIDDLRRSHVLTESELSSISCPVLAFYGEQSDVRRDGERLASLLSHCELRLMPDCTHSVLWEATEEVSRSVLDWLACRGGRVNGEGGS